MAKAEVLGMKPWQKGGVIGGGISLVMAILVYCVISSGSEFLIIMLPFYVVLFRPVEILDYLIHNISGVHVFFQSHAPTGNGYIASVIVYSLLGCLIGQIVKTIGSIKRYILGDDTL